MDSIESEHRFRLAQCDELPGACVARWTYLLDAAVPCALHLHVRPLMDSPRRIMVQSDATCQDGVSGASRRTKACGLALVLSVLYVAKTDDFTPARLRYYSSRGQATSECRVATNTAPTIPVSSSSKPASVPVSFIISSGVSTSPDRLQ